LPVVSHTNLFPYTTGVLSDTNSAKQNYVSVWQYMCPDEEYTFSTCDQRGPQSATDNDYGDTWIRLYQDDVMAKSNDDFWGANDDNESLDRAHWRSQCLLAVVELCE
jgi:hypothetical protein